MTLEPAMDGDAEGVTDVLNEAYRAAESWFHKGPRTTVGEVAARMARGTFLVHRTDGAVDACVYVEPRGSDGYLGMLAVSPRRQGSGLGPALVAAGESHLRACGVRRLEIEVINLREPLFAFYGRLGYQVTGERPFEDPRLLQPCRLVVMEKSLAAQDPASRPQP